MGNYGYAYFFDLAKMKKEFHATRVYNGYLVTESGEFIHQLKFWKHNKHHKKTPGWHIHHINGRKKDNRSRNLIYLPGDMHKLIHEVYEFKKLPYRNILKKILKKYLETGNLLSSLPKKKQNKVRADNSSSQSDNYSLEPLIVSESYQRIT